MAANSTRRWTLPLTALLFVNTALVGLAMRHVGLAAEPEAVAEVSPPIDQLEPNLTAPDTVEPSLVLQEAPSAERTLTAWDIVADVAPDWDAGLEAGAVEAICPIAAPSAGGTRWQPSALASSLPPATVTQGPAPTTVEPTIASTSPPDAADVPEEFRELLIVINPPTSGGIVHFLVDGEVVSLAPGELHRLPAKEGLRIQFHRGDDFGDAELRCSRGVFAFAVGGEGWMLDVVEGQLAARLLKVCRPAPVAIQAELD